MDSPCFTCKGACCESIVVQFETATDESLEWLNLHEGVMADKKSMRFECKCSMLKDGLCSIWNKRPQICRQYKIGSEACLNAINNRRKIKEPILKAIQNWNANSKS